MLEKKLAETFDKTFGDFQLWKPRDKLAGWPDRGIQLYNSKLIWCELKTTTIRKDNTILLSNFDQQQAVFMFKWQKARGFCFLLTAISLGQEERYGIVTQLLFKDWLNLNHNILSMDRLTVLTDKMEDILFWFRKTYIIKDKYVNHKD